MAISKLARELSTAPTLVGHFLANVDEVVKGSECVLHGRLGSLNQGQHSSVGLLVRTALRLTSSGGRDRSMRADSSKHT